MLKLSVSLRRNGARALAIACVFAAVTVSGVAAKGEDNFSGTVTESFSAAACPPGTAANLLCAASVGSGKLSHVGKVTSSFLGIVDPAALAATGCTTEAATGTLTASNGDQINVTDGNTVVCLTSPTTGSVTGTFTVSGGTGRFADASGGGTFTATMTIGDNFVGTSTEIYTGSLSMH
jgi:hypothetical protein